MRARGVLAAVLIACVVAACGGNGRTARPATIGFGDADIGHDLIEQYGCGSCHTIPGVRGADGLVGPPLNAMGSRTFIAGELANTPENMVRWVMDPQDVEPGTAMPDLGVSEDDARNIAAYLAGLTAD
jgi:cytochrome c2